MPDTAEPDETSAEICCAPPPLSPLTWEPVTDRVTAAGAAADQAEMAGPASFSSSRSPA